MTAPIVIDGVFKWFRDLVALSDVSAEVHSGVTALLGPNGAGKSTLFRVICGLTKPSQGSVNVLGRRPRRDLDLYRSVGLVPQQEELPGTLTASHFVELCFELATGRRDAGAARRAIEQVALDPDDARPLRTYSKGMTQRIKIAQALAHDPEVMLLDEPLNGLDPTQRLAMIELIQQLGNDGRTIVVSSHILEEVERIGSSILLLVAGKLAAEGDFHEIRDLMDDRPHRVVVETDRPHALAAALIESRTARGVSVTTAADGGAGRVFVDTSEIAAFRAEIAPLAVEHQARLLEVVPLDDDLDSVFRYLVKRDTL